MTAAPPVTPASQRPALDVLSPYLPGRGGQSVLVPSPLVPVVARLVVGHLAELRRKGLVPAPELEHLARALIWADRERNRERALHEVVQPLDAEVHDPPGCSHEPLTDVASVAARLGVDGSTVRRWVATGKLRGERRGWSWHLDGASVDRLVRQRGGAA